LLKEQKNALLQENGSLKLKLVETQDKLESNSNVGLTPYILSWLGPINLAHNCDWLNFFQENDSLKRKLGNVLEDAELLKEQKHSLLQENGSLKSKLVETQDKLETKSNVGLTPYIFSWIGPINFAHNCDWLNSFQENDTLKIKLGNALNDVELLKEQREKQSKEIEHLRKSLKRQSNELGNRSNIVAKVIISKNFL